MKTLFIALFLGMLAGIIDILPMIRQKVNKYSIAAIFIQWVLIALVVYFINWDISSWLKGLVIAELGMLPFMIQAGYRNKKSILPTFVFAAVLGIFLGLSGSFLI